MVRNQPALTNPYDRSVPSECACRKSVCCDTCELFRVPKVGLQRAVTPVLSCSQSEARKLAFYLFWNIKGDMARNHVILEDLEAFLQPELAEQAFAMLDTDGSGKVTLHVRLPAPHCLVSFSDQLPKTLCPQSGDHYSIRRRCISATCNKGSSQDLLGCVTGFHHTVGTTNSSARCRQRGDAALLELVSVRGVAQGMREAILAVYQDRKNLAATLKDTKTVVGTLERIMAVVIQLVFFFVYLLIWNVRAPSAKRRIHKHTRLALVCADTMRDARETMIFELP